MNNIRALCVAERFQFDALYEFLSRQTHATRMRNVIALTPDEGVRGFLFDYGVCVLFQYDYESEKRLIDQVLKYATNPLEHCGRGRVGVSREAAREESASVTT